MQMNNDLSHKFNVCKSYSQMCFQEEQREANPEGGAGPSRSQM